MSRPPTLRYEPARNKWKVVYQGRKYRYDAGSGKSDRDALRAAKESWATKKAEIDRTSEQAKPHFHEYRVALEEWRSILAWAIDHSDAETAGVARDRIKCLASEIAKPSPDPITADMRVVSKNGVSPFLAPCLPPANLGRLAMSGNSLNGNSMETQATYFTPAGMVYAPPGLELDQLAEKVSQQHRLESVRWNTRIADHQSRQQNAAERFSVVNHLDTYLGVEKSRMDAGEISVGHYSKLCNHADWLREFAGADVSVERVDAKFLAAAHKRILSDVAVEMISSTYGNHRFAFLKGFVRWLWQNEILESLPRNIDDHKLRISKPNSVIQACSVDEAKQFLAAGTSTTRLYVLLALNCAMTQADIANLHPSEVDFEKGVLSRKRTKTRKHGKNVPTVTYPIWSETLKLLKAHASPNTERVLLNRNGGPLLDVFIGDNGKMKRNDAITNAFFRLTTKLGITRSFNSLKKCSASLIRDNERFTGIEPLFLGHAESTVSGRHYAKPPERLLAEAVDWLATQYGLQ